VIVIVSALNDVHALVVQSRLQQESGKEAYIVDSADYPHRWDIDFTAAPEHGSVIRAPGLVIPSAEVEGLWLRRVLPPVVSQDALSPEVVAFCRREAYDFLSGFLGTIDNTLNDPKQNSLAAKKAFQLRVAAHVGLQVPDTLISTNPKSIRNFYDKHGGDVVFKVLTPTSFQFTETRILEHDFLVHLQSATLAPTIFQERIRAHSHLRATVVDCDLFCASVTPSRDHASLDWRLDPDPRIQETTIPGEVVHLLFSLCDSLGLRYAAIDMILNDAGDYFFLEANPGGQFLFVEMRTGQPISSAVARALTGKRKVRSSINSHRSTRDVSPVLGPLA